MKKVIMMRKLEDVLKDTKSFVTFEGSEEYLWNRLIRPIWIKLDESFFLNTINEYNVDCGWYVKYESIEPLIEELKLNIIKQDTKHIPFMMYNYNKIAEFIKSEIDCDLELLKKCKINCFYNKDCGYLCCNAEQSEISPDNPDCIKFMMPDYYEQLKAMKRLATNKIETMSLQELQAFVRDSAQDK